ncbi:MAG: hypothetical protein S4CHLAM102_16450 [Chlamydiia bacterium]|nr:hypothetical protein [Chlamydiia bacterium]
MKQLSIVKRYILASILVLPTLGFASDYVIDQDHYDPYQKNTKKTEHQAQEQQRNTPQRRNQTSSEPKLKETPKHTRQLTNKDESEKTRQKKKDSFDAMTSVEMREGRTSRLYIGPQFYYMDFSIDGQPNYNGWLGGAEGGYEFLVKDGLYTRIDGFMNAGKLDTTGTNGGTRSIRDYLIYLVFGYNFSFEANEGLRFTPYAGYGFSYISNKLTLPSLGSTTFIYQKYFIPVGMQLMYSFLENYEIGFTFEWWPFVDRNMHRSTQKGINWKLDYTNGYQIEIPFRWYIADLDWGTWDFSLMPFWRRNSDGATTATSTSGISLSLPKQTYNEWGGKFYFGYSF